VTFKPIILLFSLLWLANATAEQPDAKTQSLKRDLKQGFQEKSKTEFKNYELLQGKYQKRDYWEDLDFVFGYGIQKNKSVVLFAWKKNKKVEPATLKEVTNIYLDDQFAEIKTEKELKQWKEIRNSLSGAFVHVKKEEGTFQLLPLLYPEAKASITFKSEEGLNVGDTPLVVKFEPEKGSKGFPKKPKRPLISEKPSKRLD